MANLISIGAITTPNPTLFVRMDTLFSDPVEYRIQTLSPGSQWLTRDDLIAQRQRWRSELSLQCIDDYLSGQLFDLTLIRPSV